MKLIIVVVVYFFHDIYGHGTMFQPPGRSSLWKFNFPVAKNYQYFEVSCGGAYVQNELNGGKCGVCGDPYTDPHPQENENTGLYGTGIIAKTYKPGQVIDAGVLLTANHLGSFTYSLCILPDANQPEPESCFENLLLGDGTTSYTVTEDDYVVVNRVQLPNITCDRCVLRWTYRCGNNWGVCDDGIWRPGCGPQEHFRSCADVAILPEVAPTPAPTLPPIDPTPRKLNKSKN